MKIITFLFWHMHTDILFGAILHWMYFFCVYSLKLPYVTNIHWQLIWTLLFLHSLNSPHHLNCKGYGKHCHNNKKNSELITRRIKFTLPPLQRKQYPVHSSLEDGNYIVYTVPNLLISTLLIITHNYKTFARLRNKIFKKTWINYLASVCQSCFFFFQLSVVLLLSSL